MIVSWSNQSIYYIIYILYIVIRTLLLYSLDTPNGGLIERSSTLLSMVKNCIAGVLHPYAGQFHNCSVASNSAKSDVGAQATAWTCTIWLQRIQGLVGITNALQLAAHGLPKNAPSAHEHSEGTLNIDPTHTLDITNTLDDRMRVVYVDIWSVSMDDIICKLFKG